MNERHEIELVRRLLAHSEQEPAREHVDPELLALFAQGGLSDVDRRAVVEHLADCSLCRQVASELVKLDHEEAGTAAASTIPLARPAQRESRLWNYPLLAVAACLLVAITIGLYWRSQNSAFAENTVYNKAQRLLALSDFPAVRKEVSEAREHGTRSDRLQSLDAQAAREMPSPLALTQAGRLTDFGVDVSGAVSKDIPLAPLAKGLNQAEQSLTEINGQDVESLLNRGHVELSANRPSDARADFDRAVQLAPNDPLAWLGRGLAHFMNDELAAAEQDFRKAIELAPDAAAPRMNLAMTLQELDRKADALAEWRRLLMLPLSADERKEAERAVKLLEAT